MFLSSLTKYREFGILILRVGYGVMFMVHGVPKLMGGVEMWKGVGAAMGNIGVGAYPAVWGFLAACSESVGGACLVLGLAFRPACIFMAFTMSMATLYHFKKGDDIQIAAHAIEAGIVFLSLIFIGPGKYSIDKK